MRASRRKDLPDPIQVGPGQFRHKGRAERETLWKMFGQGKDRAQALPRRSFVHGPARHERVFGKRRLDVHGKMGPGRARKHLGHHVRPHPVGVDLDRRPERSELGHEIGEPRGQGRLAAGDDQPVQPAGMAGDEPAHGSGGQRRRGLGPPGQAGVVAMGAAQVAAAEKKHGGQATRPIAQRHGLDATHELPGRRRLHFHVIPL